HKNCNPDWASHSESTRYWNGPQTVTAVAFDDAGNASSVSASFNVNNTYITMVFTAHLCSPAIAGCDYEQLTDYVYPSMTAVAHIQVKAVYSTTSHWKGSIGATIYNGYEGQEFLFAASQVASIDWYPL